MESALPSSVGTSSGQAVSPLGGRAAADRLVLLLAGLALFHQILNQMQPPGFTLPDEIHQIIGARSWLAGYGLSRVYATPEDLATAIVEPVIGWPPGMSLLFAGALRLSNDPFRAKVLIHVSAAVIFFISWWLILRSLRGAIHWVAGAAIFLWWAFVSSPLRLLNTGDAISLAMLTAAIAAAMAVFRARGRSGYVAMAIVSGVSVGVAGACRYAYWSLLPVIPICLALLGWRLGRRFVRAGLIQLTVAGALVAGAAAYSYRSTGHLTYLSHRYADFELGFYPHQLHQMNPFPAGAIGWDEELAESYGRVSSRLGGASGWGQWTVPWLWLLSTCILWVCVAQGWRRLRSSAVTLTIDGSRGAEMFALTTTGLSLAITVVMLLYMTARYPPDSVGPGAPKDWVFGQEFRYYAPGFLFVYLGLGGWLGRFLRRPGSRLWRRRVLACCLAVLAVPPGLVRARGTYYDLRHLILGYRGTEKVAQLRSMLSTLTREVEQATRKGMIPVYAGADEGGLLLGGMAGARMLRLNASTLVPRRPEGVVILSGLRADPADREANQRREALLAAGGVSVGVSGGVEFFRLGGASGL